MALAADGERKVEDYRVREAFYTSSLVSQEHEMNQLRGIASDILGAYGDASQAALRGALGDATSNMEVLMLRQQARAQEQKITQLKDDLEANRFDQHSKPGQVLIQKCKALLSENRDLGDQIREERLAELRATVQAEQRQNAELVKKCEEAAEFCKELSQENDKLQGTIAKVAGRLRQARAELEQVKKERAEAKAQRKKEKQQKAEMAAAASAHAEQAATGDVSAPAPGEAVEVLDDDEAPEPCTPPAAPAPPAQPEVVQPIEIPVVPLQAPALSVEQPKEKKKKEKKAKDGKEERKSKKQKVELKAAPDM